MYTDDNGTIPTIDRGLPVGSDIGTNVFTPGLVHAAIKKLTLMVRVVQMDSLHACLKKLAGSI